MRVNGDTLRRFFRASVVQAADAISDQLGWRPRVRGALVSAADPGGRPVDWGSGGVEPPLPVDDLARSLFRARRERVPVPPLTEERPEMTAADAYAVQRRLVELLQADGEGDVVGHKLGLTCRAMQPQLGVDQPDYGPVLAAGVHRRGRRSTCDRLIQPKVEAEIAFVLEAHLRGPGVTAARRAPGRRRGGAPRSRSSTRGSPTGRSGWPTRSPTSPPSARVVLAGRLVPLDGLDLRSIGMV